jgi:hypothetical protein
MHDQDHARIKVGPITWGAIGIAENTFNEQTSLEKMLP